MRIDQYIVESVDMDGKRIYYTNEKKEEKERERDAKNNIRKQC